MTAMAVTAAFNPLSGPAPDDSMDMSSPTRRDHYDDDIDIDFDDFSGGVPIPDDDHMHDDVEARPPTATDASMDDDPEATLVYEEDMADDVVEDAPTAREDDDELIDYDDVEHNVVEPPDAHDGLQDQTASIFTVAADGVSFGDLDGSTLEPVDEEAVRQVENITAGESTDLAGAEVDSFVDGPVDHTEERAPPEATEPAYPPSELNDGEEIPAAAELNPTSDGHTPSVDDVTVPLSVEVDAGVAHNANGPGTPTDTGLHPMIVRFLDYEMPLFKSKSQPSGLLTNDNLASLSLAELMDHCKQRLAEKRGEDISNDRELVLGFERLPLMLSETSRAAFETSLNDVLEIYLQLHQNVGIYDIPPLFLTLSLQFKFTDSLVILKQAADNGQGLPGLTQPEEDDEYFHEGQEEHAVHNVPEAGGEEELQSQYEREGSTAVDFETTREEFQDVEEPENFANEDAQDLGNSNEQAEADEEAGEEADEEDKRDGQGQEDGQGEEDYPTETTTAFEDTLYYDLEHEDDFHNDAISHQHISHAEEAELHPSDDHEQTRAPIGSAEMAIPTDIGVAETTSSASSRTVQEDHKNDPSGEYDPDEIDWDDSSSLIDWTLDLTVDTNDEFSTFLTDLETEEFKPHGKPSSEAENFEEGIADPQHTGDAESGYEDNTEGDEIRHRSDGPSSQLGDQDDYTDTFDEQQDDVQPFVEDDQQFQAAAEDFLAENAEDDERGLEFDANAEDDDVQTTSHSVAPAAVEQAYQDVDGLDEDHIDFDDDTTEQHEARKAPQPSAAATAPGSNTDSPLGKRPFEELAEDELDFDDAEPELKKARSG